ncbi:MAG: hypothetical protein QM537_03370 [Candidatus Symbiobacter sp.]|nr:hypothetical protein [Candidatus Symbiobacter sp.]
MTLTQNTPAKLGLIFNPTIPDKDRPLYIFPPQQRAILRLTGEDRYTFLNGLVTKEISPKALARAATIPCLFLTPQGRFVQELWLADFDQALWMLTAGENLADFMAQLLRYKLRAKIALEHLAAGRAALSSLAGGGYAWHYVPADRVAESAAVSDAALWREYELARIRATIPDGGRDLLRGESHPLEYNYDILPHPAIDWDKGCYMGQEVTARTHYRGLVKFRLFTVEFSEFSAFSEFSPDAVAPVFGSVITDATGTEIGSLCTRAGGFALAHLRVDAAKSAGAVLACGGVGLRLHWPKYFVFD